MMFIPPPICRTVYIQIVFHIYIYRERDIDLTILYIYIYVCIIYWVCPITCNSQLTIIAIFEQGFY